MTVPRDHRHADAQHYLSQVLSATDARSEAEGVEVGGHGAGVFGKPALGVESSGRGEYGGIAVKAPRLRVHAQRDEGRSEDEYTDLRS